MRGPSRRIRTSGEKGKWWFRAALDARDKSGKRLREQVVILGDPGGGKTTACQRVTWELAGEGLQNYASQAVSRMPIYLGLGAYRKDSVKLQGYAP